MTVGKQKIVPRKQVPKSPETKILKAENIKSLNDRFYRSIFGRAKRFSFLQELLGRKGERLLKFICLEGPEGVRRLLEDLDLEKKNYPKLGVSLEKSEFKISWA